MARLFITPRELDFISDITKEITKDVSGQKIYYYRVREDITKTHDVYEEAQRKVFDPPIEVDARVEYQPEEFRTNRFGVERFYTIGAFIHERDMIDRGLEIRVGDFFSYGEIFFEITSAVAEVTVFGQIEHFVGMKIVGKQARQGLIDMQPLGPTNQRRTDDADAIQTNFVQQRGFEDNGTGFTGDQRDLVKSGKIEPPLSSPSSVAAELRDAYDFSSGFYADQPGPCDDDGGGSGNTVSPFGGMRIWRNDYYGIYGQLAYTDERGLLVPSTQIIINENSNTVILNSTLLPGLGSTYNIGSNENRIDNTYCNNVFTGDLHLQNDRGHWQIIEERDFLSIVNRKTNKRYKFVLDYIDDVEEQE